VVACGHGVLELVEECGVFFRAVLLGEAEGLDAFDEDFGDVGWVLRMLMVSFR
jgi:hypothetical protein